MNDKELNYLDIIELKIILLEEIKKAKESFMILNQGETMLLPSVKIIKKEIERLEKIYEKLENWGKE